METFSKVKDGWFSENCSMWPGMSLSLEIEKLLYSEQTPYQQLELYQTRNHGRMLVLDGIIQLTEFDEFTYQEMLAHIPLFAHPEPETILVIGGGDGGVLREAGKHAAIGRIDFCEIDEAVVRVSRKYLPGLACGFDDPRVNIHIGDGLAYVKEKNCEYDVIIIDSSDPIGPGEALFGKDFYHFVKNALKPGGIVAAQGESLFLHQEYVQKLMGIFRANFKTAAYAWFMVPTYPGGNIGACVGSLGNLSLNEPSRVVTKEVQSQLKFYSPQMHRAAFVLPPFAEQLLADMI